MADNKLAGLSEAENRDADTLHGGQGSDTLDAGAADSLQGGQGDGATIGGGDTADRIGSAMEADPNTPKTGEADQASADTIATRKPDTDAPAHFEPVEPPTPVVGSDAYADLGGPHVLNASPGADPLKPPSVETQRTGPTADPVYRAPSMTRGSAINNIEVRWGELVAMLHDFDRDTTGLPDDLVALVDFVKSRSAPRA